MENLTTLQIVTWSISVVFSGFMGAIAKMFFDEWKGRRQPVGYRIENELIGGPTPPDAGLHAQVAIIHNGAAYDLTNLSVIRVEIANNGNKDIDAFVFGVEMSTGERCLFAEGKGEDHHHKIAIQNLPTPDDRKETIDFRCAPFNRGDVYRINLYLELPSGQEAAGTVKLSSPMPVKFVSAPTFMESLKRYAGGVALEAGPFLISIRR